MRVRDQVLLPYPRSSRRGQVWSEINLSLMPRVGRGRCAPYRLTPEPVVATAPSRCVCVCVVTGVGSTKVSARIRRCGSRLPQPHSFCARAHSARDRPKELPR